MALEARCSCGHIWYVAPDLAGGLTNCPRCGKATEIQGLRDPFWRGIQVAAVVVWVLAVAGTYAAAGLWPAVAVGLGLAALYGVVVAFM